MNNKSCVVDEILDNIDLIQESSDEVALDVIAAMDDLYTKYGMITEQFTKPADSDIFFYQEGAIGDEMKKMKKDGESGAWTAIAAIPRFIAALSRVLLNKISNDTSVISSAKKDSGKHNKSVKSLVDGILGAKDDKTRSSNVEKMTDFIKRHKALSVVISAVAGGTVLCIKKKATGESMKYPALYINKEGKYVISEKLVNLLHGEKVKKLQKMLIKVNKSHVADESTVNGLIEAFNNGELNDRGITEAFSENENMIGQSAKGHEPGFFTGVVDEGFGIYTNIIKTIDSIGDKIAEKTKRDEEGHGNKLVELGGSLIAKALKLVAGFADIMISVLHFFTGLIASILDAPYNTLFNRPNNDDGDNNNAAVAESYNEEGVINMNNEVYVEYKNGVAVDTMRGENIKKSPNGEYHSGPSNSPAKKTAMKITGDKMCAPASKIREAMVGKNLRTVDKNGKIKLYEVTVGKSLIDKDQDIIVELKDGTATFKVSNKKCVKESYEFRSNLLNTFFGEAFVPETKEAAKKIVKKTPWGDVTIQESYEDEAEDEVIEEATFITYVDYDEMVQESADESSDGKEDDKKEDCKKAETVEECGDAASKTVEESGDGNCKTVEECGDGNCNPADKKIVSEEKKDESAEGSNETVQEEFTPNPWYSL